MSAAQTAAVLSRGTKPAIPGKGATKKAQRVMKKQLRKAAKGRKRTAPEEAMEEDEAPVKEPTEARKKQKVVGEHVFQLPIKVNGQLRILKREEEMDKSSDEEEVPEPAAPAPPAKADAEEKRDDEALCMKIAHLSSIVVEDPENNLSKLHDLRQYLAGDASTRVKKVALLSQMAIFKDILPGYRVKTGAEEAKGVTLSKEVASLRAHEQTLLNHYQHYLQAIDKLLDDAKSTLSLKAVAIQALCGLLQSAPSFNFRLNLCRALVHQAFVRHQSLQKEAFVSEEEDPALKAIEDAFVHLFREDALGEASQEGVALIAAEIKRKGYKAPAFLLKTFESLRLDAAILKEEEKKKKMPTKQQGKKQPFMTKKARKMSKEQKAVDEEMKEAEAVIRQEDRAKFVKETAKLVFSTYFRVLKNAPTSPLLPTVLEWLTHFGHLLSMEYFEDLLATLKGVMRHPDVEAKNALRCVILAINLLSGQGEALNIDARDFYVQLYSLLYTLPALHRDLHDLCLLLLQALQRGFDDRKVSSIGTPPARMPSFMARLSQISLHLPPEYTLTYLCHLSARLTTNSSLRNAMLLVCPVDAPPTTLVSASTSALHEGEETMMEDPDTASQLHAAQSWWQGAIMDYAYHPVVRELCNVICGSDGQAGSANHIFTQDVQSEQDVAAYFGFWQENDLCFRPAPKRPKMRFFSSSTSVAAAEAMKKNAPLKK